VTSLSTSRWSPKIKKISTIWVSLILLLMLAPSAHGQSNSSLSILDIRAATGNNTEMIISALDEQGNPIKGISKDNLKLTIDGKEINEFSIEPVSSAKNPISIILAIDISGSMHGRPINEAKKAASIFLDQLDKEDFIALITFGSNVKSLSDFTKEKYKIREKIESLLANEQLTWLYQATSDSLDNALRAPTSRVAVILLTDGKDEGSPKKEEDVLKRLKGMNVPIYTLGFGPAAQIDYLKTLANMSGGYFLYTPKAEELTRLYSTVLDQLKNQYLIKFNFPNPPGDYACVLSLNYNGSEISARRSFLVTSQ
jgi:VWFA-related protein